LQRPLDQLDKSPIDAEIPFISRKVTRATGREEFKTNPLLNYLLRSPPIGRFLSTANLFIDPDRDKLSAWLRALTGLRTQTFNPSIEEKLAAQRVLTAAGRAGGDVGEFQGLYGETLESKERLKPINRARAAIRKQLKLERAQVDR
jgi:hypothetical protein